MVLGSIRDQVAGRLWSVMAQEAGVAAHLTAAKNYLLMGRGDVFQVRLAPLLSLEHRHPGACL